MSKNKKNLQKMLLSFLNAKKVLNFAIILLLPALLANSDMYAGKKNGKNNKNAKKISKNNKDLNKKNNPEKNQNIEDLKKQEENDKLDLEENIKKAIALSILEEKEKNKKIEELEKQEQSDLELALKISMQGQENKSLFTTNKNSTTPESKLNSFSDPDKEFEIDIENTNQKNTKSEPVSNNNKLNENLKPGKEDVNKNSNKQENSIDENVALDLDTAFENCDWKALKNILQIMPNGAINLNSDPDNGYLTEIMNLSETVKDPELAQTLEEIISLFIEKGSESSDNDPFELQENNKKRKNNLQKTESLAKQQLSGALSEKLLDVAKDILKNEIKNGEIDLMKDEDYANFSIAISSGDENLVNLFFEKNKSNSDNTKNINIDKNTNKNINTSPDKKINTKKSKKKKKNKNNIIKINNIQTPTNVESNLETKDTQKTTEKAQNITDKINSEDQNVNETKATENGQITDTLHKKESIEEDIKENTTDKNDIEEKDKIKETDKIANNRQKIDSKIDNKEAIINQLSPKKKKKFKNRKDLTKSLSAKTGKKSFDNYIIRIRNGRSKHTVEYKCEAIESNQNNKFSNKNIGWVFPENTFAKVAMLQAKRNPERGILLPVQMNDGNFNEKRGWIKAKKVFFSIMGQKLDKPIEIHYILKTISRKNDQGIRIFEANHFKFKNFKFLNDEELNLDGSPKEQDLLKELNKK